MKHWVMKIVAGVMALGALSVSSGSFTVENDPHDNFLGLVLGDENNQ